MTEPTDRLAEEKVRAARAKAAFRRPYLGHALYALIPRQASECPTMGVDRWGRLYFRPSFVRGHDVDTLASVLLHEIGHVLRRHADRCEALGVTEATAKIANIACDCEINDDLRDELARLRDLPALPGAPFFPATIGCRDGDVLEVYYAHLMDQPRKDGAGTGQGGRGIGKGKWASNASGHDCGSAAHGVQRSWEAGDPASGRDAEGVTDADWRDIERRVAKEIREAVKDPKTRGTVPGHWEEWAEEILRPHKIPWDVELAAAVRHAISDVAGAIIHTYRRPSRRQQALPDVVLPAMRRPVPFVAVPYDTSASMSADDLALVRGTVSDICESLGAEIVAYPVDAAVQAEVSRVRDGADIQVVGRGGTDMRVGIDYAVESLVPSADVIVVLTDCETPWPAEEPPVRVVIGAIDASPEAIAACPEWATVIEISNPREATK